MPSPQRTRVQMTAQQYREAAAAYRAIGAEDLARGHERVATQIEQGSRRQHHFLMTPDEHRARAALWRARGVRPDLAEGHELCARMIERRTIRDAGLKFCDWSKLD
jgi:uncharacterized protein (DUF849 family)